MGKFKILLKKIFSPPIWILLPLIPVSIALLIFGLSERFENTPLAYISYLLSAYTLTAAVLGLPKLTGTAKKGFWELPLIRKINSHRLGNLFLNDIAFRGTASIYQGLLINTLYALFRGVTAFMFRSVWFGAIAAYYLFLSVIRLVLAVYVRRAREYEKDRRQLALFEFKGYRVCGFLMLLLNSAMSGMAVLMIRDNLHYDYPGYVIYLSAAYTFYSAITATINIFKFRKLKSPILSASKAITFTGAAMSVMALQTAMIARFGAEDTAFRQTANTLTGTAVCLGSVIIAFFMIFKGTYNIKKLNNSTEEGKETDK